MGVISSTVLNIKGQTFLVDITIFPYPHQLCHDKRGLPREILGFTVIEN